MSYNKAGKSTCFEAIRQPSTDTALLLALYLKRDGGSAHEGFRGFSMKHMNNVEPKQSVWHESRVEAVGPECGGVVVVNGGFSVASRGSRNVRKLSQVRFCFN